MEEIENYVEEEQLKVKVDNKENQQKKLRIIIVVMLLFIILLITSLYLYNYLININKLPEQAVRQTSPQITIVPTPTFTVTSWATSSSVLKIEENIKGIDHDLNNLDLNQPVLNFPSLDFNINFNKPR